MNAPPRQKSEDRKQKTGNRNQKKEIRHSPTSYSCFPFPASRLLFSVFRLLASGYLLLVAGLTASLTLSVPGRAYAEPSALEQEIQNQLVSLDIREADIRDVLNMLSEQYGLNMVIDPNVAGLVTMRLEAVTLYGALQALLGSRGYDYETNNNIIRVAATEVLGSERQIRQERLGFEPLVTEVITLRFLDANDVRPVVEGLLTERGTVSVLGRRSFSGFQFGSQTINTGGGAGSTSGGEGLIRSRSTSDDGNRRSRTLLVSDTRSSLERIKSILNGIDIPPKQILIDAKILEVETDTLEDLGIEFDSTLTIPTATSRHTTSYNRLVTAINQGISGTTFPGATDQGLDLRFNKLAGESFDVIMHTLLQDDRTRTLSSPRILVVDGQQAAMLVGEQFPIFESTVSDQGTATESLAFYQPVGISLQVIAQVTADNKINMIIHPTVSSVGSFVTGSTGLTQPRINIREADTQVLVGNNETVVMGGLLEDVDIVKEFRVPLVGHMPLIGPLFTRTRTDIDQRNLIVFITPRIIEPAETMANEQARDMFLGITDPGALGTLRERRAHTKKLLYDGKEAFSNGDYETAAGLFERVLRIDGQDRTARDYMKKIQNIQNKNNR